LHLNRLAMLTHIVSLSQAERMDEALALANDIRQGSRADPEIEAMVASLAQGKPLEFTQITTAAQGAASVFSILASALTREQAERLGLVYARLATHIRPSYDEVTTLIGDVLTGQGQYELAAAAFEEVAPTSAWYTTAEVGRAEALTGAERVDEAIEVLSSLARARPGNMSVITALGDILRREDDFSRAADAYDQAIDLIIDPTPADWRLFYVRGIAHERTDQWPKAEADFRKALELNPDQPHVLNYLGYSMVELQQNLDEALDMIERAVSQRPDDGYITDSLGWVLYRLGRYEEAVAPMERAVELLPVDPILNDHLGDVLWKVGRRTEAVFQWKRALSFDPLEKDAERIRRKLEVGLDVVLADEEAADPVAETALGD
ncbi:MAG: tetratricopeptide repeat protein, partial [Pseudomonadota bacterium]